jgi:hypothetical protein
MHDAQPAAAQPADNADQDRGRRLVRDQRIEVLAPDATCRAPRGRELRQCGQTWPREQISRLESYLVRRQPLLDHAGENLNAAAFLIVKDLQDAHRTFTRRPANFLNLAPATFNDTKRNLATPLFLVVAMTYHAQCLTYRACLI